MKCRRKVERIGCGLFVASAGGFRHRLIKHPKRAFRLSDIFKGHTARIAPETLGNPPSIAVRAVILAARNGVPGAPSPVDLGVLHATSLSAASGHSCTCNRCMIPNRGSLRMHRNTPCTPCHRTGLQPKQWWCQLRCRKCRSALRNDRNRWGVSPFHLLMVGILLTMLFATLIP